MANISITEKVIKMQKGGRSVRGTLVEDGKMSSASAINPIFPRLILPVLDGNFNAVVPRRQRQLTPPLREIGHFRCFSLPERYRNDTAIPVNANMHTAHVRNGERQGVFRRRELPVPEFVI